MSPRLDQLATPHGADVITANSRPLNESVTLVYRAGNAEHLYQPSLEAQQGGYVVNVAHAVRGRPWQRTTRTPVSVSCEEAKRIYAGAQEASHGLS